MIDRAWPNPLDEWAHPLLMWGRPEPGCPDCGETVFPGATICDSCSSPLSVERTADDTRT